MTDISLLRSFELEEILNEEPEKCRLTLLGTLPPAWNASTSESRLRAIIRIEKNAFASENAPSFFGELIHKMQVMETTDIYTWIAGWISSNASEAQQPHGDVKINVICPATEVHIRKYTKQQSILVRETPHLYETITKPYIAAFPPSRTRWVTEILSGRAERDKVLFSSDDFLLLPDMKWDLHTVGSLYLVAIARDPELRSLRDLHGERHLDLLKMIRREAYRVAGERWGIGRGELRMWVHYQPSYYHFHVHIVNANYEISGMGMAVGQAHLLEDVISLLEIDPTIFGSMTLTYGLGEQHGLYEQMQSAQEQVEIDWTK